MKAISIRNVPDHIYARLQTLAKTNHRSLQEQIKVILEQEVNLSNRSFLAGAVKWRQRLQERNLSDTVKTVRRDRQR